MRIYKFAIALAIVGVLAGPFNASKVYAFAPPPPSVTVTTSGAATGAWITGGFIGAVAVICVYDIYLKLTGVKNWDGSMKAVAHPRAH
ncbi:MAG: hypothetical protein GC182_17160 [Rhodopseudomonas sp.]|nr:hypothetical protein [Rhodopseudomonas sp.]